jgi:hypothetical protein
MKKRKFFINGNDTGRFPLEVTIIAAGLGKLRIVSSLLGPGDLLGRG